MTESDENMYIFSKKGKLYVRMQEVMKKKLNSHQTGLDCKCLKHEHFKNVSASERNYIVLEL